MNEIQDWVRGIKRNNDNGCDGLCNNANKPGSAKRTPGAESITEKMDLDDRGHEAEQTTDDEVIFGPWALSQTMKKEGEGFDGVCSGEGGEDDHQLREPSFCSPGNCVVTVKLTVREAIKK